MLRDKVIAIYCFTDDLLKAINHKDKRGVQTNDAAIITTALISAFYLRGNQSHAIAYMRSHNVFSCMPLKSGFTKRLHGLSHVLLQLFSHVGALLKDLNCSCSYILDSFPLAVCHNMRQARCRLLQARCRLLRGKKWRGYCASKRQYFHGIKVQLITRADGIPVEVCFVPGSENDVVSLRRMLFDLPEGSELYADAGYTDYVSEDIMEKAGSIVLKAARKHNSKRPDEPWQSAMKSFVRKRIETTISGIVNLMPRCMHAVTFSGFCIKIMLFILAYQFNAVI